MKQFCKIFILLIQIPVSIYSQQVYPKNVLVSINSTRNKPNLEKALHFFYTSGDELKIKSINFLIANMPIHKSYSYFWANEAGQKIPFDELAYPTYAKMIEAFEKLKLKTGRLHPIAYTYKDIDSITSNYLIEDVDLAVKKYREKNAENKLGDDNFFDYILPYRASIEPLQNWRNLYTDKFNGVINPNEPLDSQILSVGKNIKTWFTNTYKIAGREEPLPRLGALQLLSRAKGACEDIAGLATFMIRSQGYAATVDFVPAWATASGLHYLNFVNIGNNNKHHYDAADGFIVDSFIREPAKVLRTTYSIQPKTIASLINDTSQIPIGFMRLYNYKDVTDEYWQTSDITSKIFNAKFLNPKVVFISVWNFLKWNPVWYSKIETNNNHATFTKMCKGAVFLPMFYFKNKLSPAGWPIINGYGYTKVLQTDTLNKRTVYIKEQAKYLAFKEGKNYMLLYWNNQWVKVGSKIATKGIKELKFESVPNNALLLLIPEYSQGKERPFIITESGERLWF